MAKETLTFAATGRRKTSVARVRLTEGSGNIIVNGLEVNKYFNTNLQQDLLKKPFTVQCLPVPEEVLKAPRVQGHLPALNCCVSG